MTELAQRLVPAAVGPPSRAVLMALAAALFLLFGVGAAASPTYALALVVGAIFAALVFRNLALGVSIFAVLTFFVRLPGTGAGGGAGVTIVKLGGIVLAAAWVLKLISDSEKPFLLRDAPLLAAALSGLAVWSFSSALWAEDSHVAISSSLRFDLNFLFVFIVFSALVEPRHFRWLMWGWVAAAIFTAASGIFSGSNANADTTSAVTDASSRLVGRYGAGDPNFLAALLVPALVFVAFFFVLERRRGTRLLLLAAGAFLLIALFQTESRGGLVALAATGLMSVVLAGGRRRARVALVVGVLAVMGVTYFGAIASPASRGRVTRISAQDSSGRNDLWRVGLAVAADHPAFGVGAGNFTVVSPRYAEGPFDIVSVNYVVDTPKVTHNTYLNVLDELGLPGLLFLGTAFASALVPAIRRVNRLARDGDFEMEMLGRAIVLGTIGMLVAQFFFSGQYEKQLWLLMGASAAFASLASARRQA